MVDMAFKDTIVKVARFLLNPHFLVCFGIAWIITNGWAYVLLAVGTYLGITWMITVSGAYLAFLWIPFTPEKIITVLLSMLLLKLIFPNDEKTLGTLKGIYAKAKIRSKKKKQLENDDEIEG